MAGHEDPKQRIRELRQLEHRVHTSVEASNGIVTLLQHLALSHPTSVTLAAMHALRRVFTLLIDEGEMKEGRGKGLRRKKQQQEQDEEEGEKEGGGPSKRARASSDKGRQGTGEKAAAAAAAAAAAEAAGEKKPEEAMLEYRQWLWARFDEFVTRLTCWLSDCDDLNIQGPALRTLMEFVRRDRADGHLSRGLIFTAVLDRLLLVEGGLPTKLLEVFASEFINSYDDVRYHLLVRMKAMIDRVLLLDKQDDGGREKGGGRLSVAAPSHSPLLKMSSSAGGGGNLSVFGAKSKEKRSRRRITAPLSARDFAENCINVLMEVRMVEEQADLTAFLVEVSDDGADAEEEGGEGGDTDEEGQEEDEATGGGKGDVMSSAPTPGANKRKRGLGGGGAASAADKAPKLKRVQRIGPHRRAFGSAWLACLQLPVQQERYRAVLTFLPEHVMPYMGSALKLADFLTESYKLGGIYSVLSIDALFILMQEHNLDHPQFYDSLYALLTTDTFYARYRARFFRMCELYLSSSHLPAYLVAAFCKRLARVALSAPPSGSLFALALVKNMLQRHREVAVLIHRDSAEVKSLLSALKERHEQRKQQEHPPKISVSGKEKEVEEQKEEHQPQKKTVKKSKSKKAGTVEVRAVGMESTGGGVEREGQERQSRLLSRYDGFDAHTNVTAETNALNSSLWEVAALQSHYHPAVSSLAKTFRQKMGPKAVSLKVGQEYAGHTYKTLFDEEMKKKKAKSALTFVAPDGIMGKTDLISQCFTLT